MTNGIRWDQLESRRKCIAHHTDGRKCNAYALTGLDVCNYHGGMTPDGVDKNRTARALQIYSRMTNTLGTPVEVSPEEGLLQEIARTNGHILWLQEQILTSDVRSFVASAWLYRRSVDSTIRWDDDTARQAEEAFEGVWLDLYQKERQHFARLCQIAINAGIEERKVRLAERQADQIGQAITVLLKDLGHDPADLTVRAVAFKALTHASGQHVIEGETE